MQRIFTAALTLIAVTFLPLTAIGQTSPVSFELTYLDRFKIDDDDEGVAEPSGLVLSLEGDALWTVSDDQKEIFKISLDGNLQDLHSIGIDDKDLEGITIDPTDGALVVVKEKGNEILKISPTSEEEVLRHALSDLAGFGDIERHFPGEGDDKGLEGITFNPDTGTFFLLKEAEPGLMIEISKDLSSILGAHPLDAANGFVDNDIEAVEIDFSGIHYDQSRSLFWVVSDRARRLFLYDFDQDRVLQSTALSYTRDGEYREIKKPEGIAIDSRSHRLYVVSDKEARLYVFDLRGG